MQAVYWLFTHPVNKVWVEGSISRELARGVRDILRGATMTDWRTF